MVQTRVSLSDFSMVEDIDGWKEQWGDYMDYHMTALGKRCQFAP